MKSAIDIDHQINRVQSAIMALNAMNTTVHSIMILGSRPVIRIAKNSHCSRMIEEGKASYTHIGHDASGRYRQGTFELDGCRIFWSESLH